MRLFKLTSLSVLFSFSVVIVLCANSETATSESFKSSCDRTFSDSKFVLKSPGYPDGYLRNSYCYYLFKGSNCPTYFKFQLTHFNLTSSPGCSKDRLEILEKDALCGNLRGDRYYFAEDGVLQARFLSDEKTLGGGFEILVTRLACGVKPETITARNSEIPFCCANSYSSKHFYLASPGFPRSNREQSECVYHIYRENSNICCLRIQFLFFMVGEPGRALDCNKGFVEVDGKFICGCREGLKLTSVFDSSWGNAPKVLRFKSNVSPRNVFSGFVIEVIQDECPKRLEPKHEDLLLNYQSEHGKLRLTKEWTRASEDGGNEHVFVFEKPPLYENVKIKKDIEQTTYKGISETSNFTSESWGEHDIGKSRLTKELTKVSEDGVNEHVFVFEEPDHYKSVEITRDIEQTIYKDISEITNFTTDYENLYKCKNWGELEINMLTQQVPYQQMPECNINSQFIRRCENVNYMRGFIQSPGYPDFYRGSTKLCYRLHKYPGYCGIGLSFVDFNIRNSYRCRKDYLLLGGKYRYCGQNLLNAMLTFDLRNKPYEEIHFVSSFQSCGKGFRAIYEQLPCPLVELPNPVNPVPPPIPPPIPSQIPCSRIIQEEFFVIEVFGQQQRRCVFNIQKLHPSVCLLELTFLDFNLLCGREHLIINNQRYCGQISRNILNVNFNAFNQVSIIYEQSGTIPLVTGLRFRLRGRQMNIGCDPYPFPEVPAQRLLINHTNTDICGLISKAMKQDLAAAICENLTKRSSSIICIPITAQTIYLPYTSNYTENNLFSLFDLQKFEKLLFKEISCHDLHRIIKNE